VCIYSLLLRGAGSWGLHTLVTSERCIGQRLKSPSISHCVMKCQRGHEVILALAAPSTCTEQRHCSSFRTHHDHSPCRRRSSSSSSPQPSSNVCLTHSLHNSHHLPSHHCQEWMALITALDYELQHELALARDESPTETASTRSTSGGSASPDDLTSSLSGHGDGGSGGMGGVGVGGPLTHLDESRQKFVSEYLDDFVELPARALSSPGRLHSGARAHSGARPSSVGAGGGGGGHHAVVVDLPSLSLSSSSTAEANLTEGCMPGTMPQISLFLGSEFSPSDERLARVRDIAKRAPSLKLEGPAGQTPTSTPMPPPPLAPGATAQEVDAVERRCKSPRSDEPEPLPPSKHAKAASSSSGSKKKKKTTVVKSSGSAKAAVPRRSALLPRQTMQPSTAAAAAGRPKTAKAATAHGRPKSANAAASAPRPATASSPRRGISKSASYKQPQKPTPMTAAGAGRLPPAGVVPALWKNPDVSIL
jgi:hypothetical protein